MSSPGGDFVQKSFSSFVSIEGIELVGDEQVDERKGEEASERVGAELRLEVLGISDGIEREWRVSNLLAGFEREESVRRQPQRGGDIGEDAAVVEVPEVEEEGEVVEQFERESPVETEYACLLDCSAEAVEGASEFSLYVSVQQSLYGIKWVEKGFEGGRVDELLSERFLPGPEECLVGGSGEVRDVDERASEVTLEEAIHDHRLKGRRIGIGEEKASLQPIVRLSEGEESLNSRENC